MDKSVRLIAFSDSHGDKSALKIIDGVIKDGDYLAFAGDGLKGVIDKFGGRLGQRLIAVKGNCDFMRSSAGIAVKRIGGVNVLVLHGHSHGVKYGLGQLTQFAKTMQSGIVIYGHTHIAAVNQTDNIWLINPGSIAAPRAGGASYAEIIIDDKDITAQIIYI